MGTRLTLGTSDYADEPRGLSHYGYTGGVRHFLNAIVALYGWLELRKHRSITIHDLHFRAEDDLTLNAKLVTHFPRRRSN